MNGEQPTLRAGLWDRNLKYNDWARRFDCSKNAVVLEVSEFVRSSVKSLSKI